MKCSSAWEIVPAVPRVEHSHPLSHCTIALSRFEASFDYYQPVGAGRGHSTCPSTAGSLLAGWFANRLSKVVLLSKMLACR